MPSRQRHQVEVVSCRTIVAPTDPDERAEQVVANWVAQAPFDNEHCVRVDGTWLSKRKAIGAADESPFEAGWPKTRFA